MEIKIRNAIKLGMRDGDEGSSCKHKITSAHEHKNPDEHNHTYNEKPAAYEAWAMKFLRQKGFCVIPEDKGSSYVLVKMEDLENIMLEILEEDDAYEEVAWAGVQKTEIKNRYRNLAAEIDEVFGTNKAFASKVINNAFVLSCKIH